MAGAATITRQTSPARNTLANKPGRMQPWSACPAASRTAGVRSRVMARMNGKKPAGTRIRALVLSARPSATFSLLPDCLAARLSGSVGGSGGGRGWRSKKPDTRRGRRRPVCAPTSICPARFALDPPSVGAGASPRLTTPHRSARPGSVLRLAHPRCAVDFDSDSAIEAVLITALRAKSPRCISPSSCPRRSVSGPAAARGGGEHKRASPTLQRGRTRRQGSQIASRTVTPCRSRSEESTP